MGPNLRRVVATVAALAVVEVLGAVAGLATTSSTGSSGRHGSLPGGTGSVPLAPGDTTVPGTTAGATTTSTGPPASASTTTAAGGAPSTAQSGATTTTPKGPPTTSPPGSGPVPAAVGTYKYRQSGNFTIPTGTKAIPPEGKLVVDAAGAGGVQVWHRYVDPSQSPADTTYSFLSSGVFLDKTVMKAGSQDATCAFSPPLPVPAWPPTVGATFAGKATCTGVSLTVTVKGRITGTKDVTIDGSVHHTFVLDATESISGAVTGTGTQVAWVDPATSLVLHEVNTLQGNYGVFSFSSTETGDLESTHPS